MDNAGRVQDFISSRVESHSAMLQNSIAIAVDEIFSNIARYAYQPLTGSVKIRVTSNGGVTIQFEDSGAEFDPLSAETPDVTLQAEDREIGGLGIFIVRNTMDSVEYKREDGKNILTIRKREE